ncbi:Nucleoside triphosphate pyrophosphohydrolase [bioreactor metagenome]|uniref:Nucleoside triphosphate pyrophosphohydrolase n=1 Tax=bioreactor metagenome TaxID=1076179 RepID=A0A645HM28_9ZZZZ
MKTNDQEHIDSELGDLLFAVANLSRFRKRESAELLLARATKKFKRRFAFIEKKLAEQNRVPEKCTLEELDALWNEAKKQESHSK